MRRLFSLYNVLYKQHRLKRWNACDIGRPIYNVKRFSHLLTGQRVPDFYDTIEARRQPVSYLEACRHAGFTRPYTVAKLRNNSWFPCP